MTQPFRSGGVATLLTSIAILVCSLGAVARAGSDPRGSGAKLSPAEKKTTLDLAHAARSAGDFPAAIAFYRRVAGPGADPLLQVEFADTLLQGGYVDDAIGVYQSTPPRSPAELGALLGLERCYAQLGQSGRALDYARQAVAAAPDDEAARVGLGVALDVVGRHAEAQGAYRVALASSPRSVAARSDLALSLSMTGQFDQAIDLLTPLARSANGSPRVRQNLALIYGLKGDRLRALSMGSVDLATADAEANLRFFDFVRARTR